MAQLLKSFEEKINSYHFAFLMCEIPKNYTLDEYKKFLYEKGFKNVVIQVRGCCGRMNVWLDTELGKEETKKIIFPNFKEWYYQTNKGLTFK